MKRPHHYYKIKSDSEIGMKLHEFFERCDEVSEIAAQWAEAHGAEEYLESPAGMAGGVSALIVEKDMPLHGFDTLYMPDGTEIAVPDPGSDVEKEMFALPVVSEMELIQLLCFKPRTNKKGELMPFTFGDRTPAIALYEGYWYADVPYECDNSDIISISRAEFRLVESVILGE